jgi:hypothetical protein
MAEHLPDAPLVYHQKLYPKMKELPNDPIMLFSVVNMKLRDIYDSLDALCDDMNISKEQLCEKLAAAGYEYSEQYNKFW